MFVSCAKKEDADINKIVSDAYPNVSIESLKKIDENFHEIIINNQIYYATNDGKYLIVGSVIDLDTKESITENTKMEQRLNVINSIDQSYQVNISLIKQIMFLLSLLMHHVHIVRSYIMSYLDFLRIILRLDMFYFLEMGKTLMLMNNLYPHGAPTID